MKKVLIGIFLCLVPVFIASLVIGGPTYTNREVLNSAPRHINYKSGDTDWATRITDSNDIRRHEGRHDGARVIFDADGVTRYYVNGSGDLAMYDASSNRDTYIPSDKIVIIDTLAELSTWSGAEAGSSYFQTDVGKTYFVDFEAIRTESKGTTTGVTTSPWSGVSAILPLANSTSNLGTVTIGIICSGSTGYAPMMAGVTTVQVWPATLAGATRFGEPSVGNQNMMYHSSSSTPFYVGSSTNTYDVGINYLNESITWRLFNNSSVSAQIVDQTLSQ